METLIIPLSRSHLKSTTAVLLKQSGKFDFQVKILNAAIRMPDAQFGLLITLLCVFQNCEWLSL